MNAANRLTHNPSHFKETNMADQHHNDKASRSIETSSNVRAYPSNLHAMLDMTAQEVEADIRARGKDPKAILARFDEMLLAFPVQHQPFATDNSDMIDVPEISDGLESLRIYEDSVAAGIPMGNSSDAPRRWTSRTDLFGHQDYPNTFFAKVSGWSMKGDRIIDGDAVLVDSKAIPKDGDVVLANIAGQGQVVKRLRIIDGEQMILESANSDFKPIVIDDPAQVVIHGVVTGLAARFKR